MTSAALGQAAELSPNIVLFVADDLGWGDTGCYGATRIPTPHIDELADRGRLFVDCHATSAVCTPSRYSILTGRYPWRSPLQSGVLGGADPSIIGADVPTIASVLAQSNYRTGAFGKWHLGLGWTFADGSRRSAFDTERFHPDMEADGVDIDYTSSFGDGPLAHGFDTFFGIAGSLDMPPYCFLEQDRTRGIPDRPKRPLVTSQRPGLQVPQWRDDQVDLRFVETANQWIAERANEGDRFLAYIASAAPHRPCVPPQFVRGLSQAGSRGDAVCLVDWMLGSVVDTLLQCGVLGDTIIIFTSDNGAPTCFPEDGDVTIHRPNGLWRGQKADAWEGGHRVPLIIAGPGVQTGRDNATVSLLDLLPTIVHITRADPHRSKVDGTNMESVSSPSDGPSRQSDDRIIGHQAFDGTLALRQQEFKAIYGTGSGGFSEPIGVPCGPSSDDGQLYNLSADPVEAHNLWRSSSERVARMHAEFCRRSGFEAQSDRAD